MTKPHHPAAFINALSEEGTKKEIIFYLQKTWDELCELKKQPCAECGARGRK